MNLHKWIGNPVGAGVADSLMKDQGILTVARSLGTVGCIRVTPALYNSVEEMQKLVGALRNTQ